jgi:hypothetical protein
MQELKFRAWIEKDEQMVDVYKLDFFAKDGRPVLTMWYLLEIGTQVGLAKGFRLMQFTGLRDKYDKEIYEGDFVKDTDNLIYVVKWIDEMASFKLVSTDGYMINLVFPVGLEVIGNVYENPEIVGDK